MRRKGFSFACPTFVNDKDEVFHRFHKTAIADPDKIINPWPQMVYPDNLNQAFSQAQTQPLVNMWYLPTSNLDLYVTSGLEQIVTFIHEVAHLIYDATPAKILARVILDDAYRCVEALINKESWNEEMWRELLELNTRLSSICEAITLSEELLAIALSFGCMFTSPEYSTARVELERLERESVKKYQKLYRHFGALYYNTFKKLGASRFYEKSDLEVPLGMFLQGINVSQNGPGLKFEVVDSNMRCSILAEKLMGMKNVAELMDWITQTLSPYELYAYDLILVLQVAHREWSRNGSRLWTLLEGTKPYKGLSDLKEVSDLKELSDLKEVSDLKELSDFRIAAREAARDTRLIFIKPDRVKTILSPRESEGNWAICPDISGGSRSQLLASFALIGLESIRQQLDEAKGICCPDYIPGICECAPSWREALWRILQWAREGKFGDGEWRDMPPECHGRV